MDTWPHAFPCAKPRAYLINSVNRGKKTPKPNKTPNNPKTYLVITILTC